MTGIEILNEARLRYWCSRLSFPAEAIEKLVKIAGIIQQDRELASHFAAYHEKTAVRGEWHRVWSELPFDPLVQARLGTQTSLFYLLAYLAALPSVEQKYQRLGIETQVFDDTMSDFRIWLHHESDLRGALTFERFAWVWRHLDLQLFRLGRLQYVLAPFHGLITAFRNKATGAVLLLADPNLPLRADGYALGAGAWPDHAAGQAGTSWNAIYEENPAGWRGNPVSPYGFVLKEPIFLPRPAWDLILKNGDMILELHIPRNDPFTVEDCRESFRQAFEFFPRHWPEQPFKASACHTWFFTPQLQEMLPPESNIVRFQREFYLYPSFPGSLGFLWSFAFGERWTLPDGLPDLANAPRDTRLRKAVLEWVDQGKQIFDLSGVMFHGPQEWGSQPYMRAWDRNSTQ